jgi:hypothetical protein
MAIANLAECPESGWPWQGAAEGSCLLEAELISCQIVYINCAPGYKARAGEALLR